MHCGTQSNSIYSIYSGVMILRIILHVDCTIYFCRIYHPRLRRSHSVVKYSCDRLVEQGLTSHQTHYRSYRGQLGQNDPTNSVKALKEDRVLTIRLQSHQVHPTVLQ